MDSQVIEGLGKSSEGGREHQAVQWVRPADREGLSEQVEDQPVQRPWGGPVINHGSSSREMLWCVVWPCMATGGGR